MNIRRFGMLVLTVSLLLPIQFLLGMGINLFVEIPKPVVVDFFGTGGGILIIIHALNGLAIGTLAIILAVLATGFKQSAHTKLSLLGIVTVFLAIGSGITFLFLGQIDAFSYTMSIGLATSAVVYAFLGRYTMELGFAQRMAAAK